MFIKNWKKELFSIPNLLSMFRLILIPVYIRIYLNATEPEHYYVAGGILAVSCLTDMIDGQIARHFNMISNVGKLLDPLADKMTQLALTLCLSVKYPALRSVLLLFVIKELFQASVTFVMFRRGKVLPGALIPGKVCPVVLFISLIAMVLFPNMHTLVVNSIAIVDALFLAFSFVSYILAYYGKNTKVENYRPE